MNWIITLLLLGSAAAHADVFVTGTGVYRMSDRDTDEEAQRLAFQRALAEAREQAGPLLVSSESRWAVSEWGGHRRHEMFDQETAVVSSARLRLASKVLAPVEEEVCRAVRLGSHTVLVEDRVRYWTCAVRVEVVEQPADGMAASGLPADTSAALTVPLAAKDTGGKARLAAAVSELPCAAAVPGSSQERYRPLPRATRPAAQRRGSAQERLFDAGLDHVLQGNWRAARGHFREVLQRNPTHGDALFLLAFCLEKSGEHQAFRQVLSRAVRSHPHKSIYGVLEARFDGSTREALLL